MFRLGSLPLAAPLRRGLKRDKLIKKLLFSDRSSRKSISISCDCRATSSLPSLISSIPTSRFHSSSGSTAAAAAEAKAEASDVSLPAPLREALKFSPGQKLHGYTVEAVQSIPELVLVAVLVRHDVTGAKHLHLARDDADNSFSVGFRTTPMDSTGVPHILEHTVLCGSKKYPVRDPFFKMMNRSMATFMNAMTASDWTAYPFSTQNPKDFDNLLDVYLDAAFFPNLRSSDFRQEGWRLEHENVEDPQSPIIIKGVVFNEMKGVFSDSQRLYHQAAQNGLLPSHTYGVCSGGDPLKIPDLTWNQLKEFHASHYHPSNSIFITYGDLPLETHLERIQERALSKFTDNIDPGTDVPSEPRWATPRSATITCAPDAMAPVPGRETVVSRSYLLSPVTDDFEVFLLSIVGRLLVESETSPFYRALIGSQLGADFSPNTGYDNGTRDTSFAVGLQGVAPGDVNKVLSLIDETWDQVVENGFEDADVDAVLHSIELGLKHQTTNAGLRMMFVLIPSVNHGGDPLKTMSIEEKVQRFKQLYQDDPKLLNEFVRRHFKDNSHIFTLTMTPDKSFDADVSAKEKQLLAAKLEGIDEAARTEIFESGKELAAEQSAPEENISILPSLSLQDVDRNVQLYAIDSHDLPVKPGSKLYLCPQPTTGVTYMRLLFSLDGLPEQYLPFVPIFADLLTQMGAGQLDFAALSREIDLCSGGFSSSTFVNDGYQDLEFCERGLLIGSHSLNRKFDRSLEIWSSILNDACWEDMERLETLIRMAAADAASSLLHSGHSYAMRHAASTFTPSSCAKEMFSGVTRLEKLKKLATMVELEGPLVLVPQLLEISSHVLRRSNVMRVAVNVDPDNAVHACESVENFVLEAIPEREEISESERQCEKEKECRNTHFELPFQVNFVSTAFPTVAYSHPDCAPLRVLSKLLSWKFLHREIREKGGAYGGGANATTDGAFCFYSYRDPRSVETMRVYEESVAWALDGGFEPTDLDEAKMSLFQQIDKPVAPGSRGVQFSIIGLSDDLRQEQRDRIFGASADDLRRVADKYLKPELGFTTILGPKNPLIEDGWNKITFE